MALVFPVTMMSLQCNEFLELKTRHKGSLSCEQAQEKREVGRGREQMGGGGRRRRGVPTPTPTAYRPLRSLLVPSRTFQPRSDLYSRRRLTGCNEKPRPQFKFDKRNRNITFSGVFGFAVNSRCRVGCWNRTLPLVFSKVARKSL